ncbi:uncharacterized protein IUM83_01723 [Phytophthora cinnamomi]|uniref:uncharacterized protein n=1 Tax=Phytophthora cinnamomi TaxID=4785 RepID=UPI00355AB236|nr:hypothetical protein IUM83_01723 [Phytophthora cinnamomi]
MLGPPEKRPRRFALRYEVNMLVDHRTEDGIEQFRVTWRHYPQSTWEPASMLKDDGIPDWYFHVVLQWKSSGGGQPFMKWVSEHVLFARLMQARGNQNDCAQHAVDMALQLLGHVGAVTQEMKNADMAAAKKKGIDLSKVDGSPRKLHLEAVPPYPSLQLRKGEMRARASSGAACSAPEILRDHSVLASFESTCILTTWFLSSPRRTSAMVNSGVNSTS